MDLSGIISISGKSGLFKMITQSKNCVIVESFIDKKRFPAFASHQISTLEDISVFTTTEKDMPLKEAFLEIFKNESTINIPENRSDEKLVRAYLKKVLPTHDEERVHFSDIKKMLSWYLLLKEHGYIKEEVAEKAEEKEI